MVEYPAQSVLHHFFNLYPVGHVEGVCENEGKGEGVAVWRSVFGRERAVGTIGHAKSEEQKQLVMD
jgi:hypothetical protein